MKNISALSIRWDNPYWLFCKKGELVNLKDNSCLLRFEIQKGNDSVRFIGNELGETTWNWAENSMATIWDEAHPGKLIDNDGFVLAKTTVNMPNRIREKGVVKSTVLNVDTSESHYTINWDLTLWLNLISRRDIMTLCDSNGGILLKSITPNAYNKIFIMESTDEMPILLTVFTAYHLKIPMDCIGDD